MLPGHHPCPAFVCFPPEASYPNYNRNGSLPSIANPRFKWEKTIHIFFLQASGLMENCFLNRRLKYPGSS